MKFKDFSMKKADNLDLSVVDDPVFKLGLYLIFKNFKQEFL